MSDSYNRMYFSKEDVEAGLMSELISFLCKYSYESGPRGLAHYNDIHINPEDCGAFSVEWVQRPWSNEYGGRFEYLQEDQMPCYEFQFPDGHYIYTPEPEEDLEIWLKDNPGWYKDDWGHWHQKCDNDVKDLQQMQFYKIDDQD